MKITTSGAWLVLLGLQALLGLVIFRDFLFGEFYFAYIDIGSDSYFTFVPNAMHLARAIAGEGFPGWSFEIGLGGPTAWLPRDAFTLLNAAGGPDNVLPLRIWIYLLKILLGGMSFFLLIRCYAARWETAVIGALAYSFCGFAVINGQWDPEATEFVFVPLIVWALVRHLRTGNVIALPLVLAVSLISGAFFIAMGVFLLLSCAAFVVTSSEPWAMFRRWLTGIVPLVVIGFLLAAPHLLPVILQMSDSPRIGGGQSLFQRIWQDSLVLNDWRLVLAQIGGIFHKDIFGIGNGYQGYWNYLEGPGFFIGVTLFLLIPQLWKGSAADRKVLLIGACGVAVYFMFPLIRYAAMGFAAPYFRVSTLWITVILLLLAVRALDRVLERGLDGRLLAIGVAGYLLLLIMVLEGDMGTRVWMPHIVKILALSALAGALLLLAQRNILSAGSLPQVILCAVMVETVLIAHPSYVEGRLPVSQQRHAYSDATLDALREIRAVDNGVFRIEKTYDSVALGDATAQNYMGIKSYSSHGSGVVDFHIGAGLIPPTAGAAINYTNWLPNAGERFMLNTLLGVKYIIAKEPLTWPGFETVREARDYRVYRNEAALPLGIVQTQQITQGALSRLKSLPKDNANLIRDIVMINAVVVDRFIPEHGDQFDLDELLHARTMVLRDRYFDPVMALQETGLRIEEFSSDHISGDISPTKAGILVFSIPYSRGWSLKLDGKETPMIRANFGMLATPVQAGAHTVELDFRLPGRREGLLLGTLGLVLLALRRRKYTIAEGRLSPR
jgi:uncharacterized membrane protein YfhO